MATETASAPFLAPEGVHEEIFKLDLSSALDQAARQLEPRSLISDPNLVHVAFELFKLIPQAVRILGFDLRCGLPHTRGAIGGPNTWRGVATRG